MQIEKLKKMIIDRYLDMTKKSAQYAQRAREYLPGGDTRSAAFFRPYPFCTAKGEGCKITDIDGNVYMDFLNNFTSLIHGHAHPQIVPSIIEQAKKGTVHGTPVEQQFLLSELICNRIPSIDQVRYCNSASEATMFAMRAARAFTKRDSFIRIDGGYNGCHDYVEVNITPDYNSEGLPVARVEPGIPGSTLLDTYVVPFNDLDSAQAVLEKYSDKIAGIIMEPMLGAGGLIMPETGYLEGMRQLADRYNVLLIFDETISLRFHSGGLHTMENVRGDIIAMGKIIGGGFPVGAFGARKEIMDIFNPEKDEFVTHSGTFSGNAMVMAAGYASMKLLTQIEIDRINALGDRMRNGFKKIYEDVGIEGQIAGFGSIVGPNFSGKPFKNAKDNILSVFKYKEVFNLMQLSMLARGIYYAGRGMFAISTVMGETEIDTTINAFKESIEEMKPIIDSCKNRGGLSDG